MAGPNTPVSFSLAASSSAPATQTLTVAAQQLSIVNRTGAGEVFITIDGTPPTVGGTNQFFIPAAITELVIDVAQGEQGEKDLDYLILQAISGSALSLWVTVH